MQEYLIELRGHKFDLENLAKLLTADDFAVIKEGEEFRLKCTAFNSLTNEDMVFAAAKSLLPSVNGVGFIYADGFRAVELSGGVIAIDGQGTRKRYVYESVHQGLRIGQSAEVASDHATPQGPTPGDEAIKAALNEEIVGRALGFFSQVKSWVNLYKVLDAIREDVGNLEALKARKWVASSEIDRFKGTANNHTAAEGEARHGFDYGNPMSKPMTIQEAEQLIRTLLSRWLASRKQ